MPTLSRWIMWALLALPAAVVVARQLSGAIPYGAALQESGEWAVRLLLVTLALSPLRLAYPRAGWTLWLARRRRDLGVATFSYAALHTLAYLIRKAEMPILIWREGLEPGMAVGWVALAAFAALAITSNDASVRALRARWKRLHRLVYPAAVLALAHWILTAFDPFEGAVHAAVLGAIVATRVLIARRQGRAT